MGIYFHKINKLQLSNAQWRLITYVNITNYNEKYNQIDNIMQKINKSCELGTKIENESIKNSCLQWHNHALNFLIEINNNRNHVLRAIDNPKLGRSRPTRGLINAVGRVANVLFGVCDDSDAEYFYNKIKELDNSKDKTIQILDSQTNIIKTIVSVVNDTLIENEHNQKSLADSYSHLLHEMETHKIELGIMHSCNSSLT